MRPTLKQKFEGAHQSLVSLAAELESQTGSDKLDSDEIAKLKTIVDKVRLIIWQMQQNIGQKRPSH